MKINFWFTTFSNSIYLYQHEPPESLLQIDCSGKHPPFYLSTISKRQLAVKGVFEKLHDRVQKQFLVWHIVAAIMLYDLDLWVKRA